MSIKLLVFQSILFAYLLSLPRKIAVNVGPLPPSPPWQVVGKIEQRNAKKVFLAQVSFTVEEILAESNTQRAVIVTFLRS